MFKGVIIFCGNVRLLDVKRKRKESSKSLRQHGSEEEEEQHTDEGSEDDAVFSFFTDKTECWFHKYQVRVGSRVGATACR